MGGVGGIYFNRYDLLAAANTIPEFAPLAELLKAKQSALPQADAQLQEENAQFRERIAELEAALARAESQQENGQKQAQRTANATEARNEKTADEWERHLRHAVQLAVHVAQTPPKEVKGQAALDNVRNWPAINWPVKMGLGNRSVPMSGPAHGGPGGSVKFWGYIWGYRVGSGNLNMSYYS